MELKYGQIEQQLTGALPELQSVAEYYWKTEGEPGKDAGPYIFFESMFACYVKVLLAMPDSASRRKLLQRAFAFVEEMLASSDREVQDLAFIGLYEGRPVWWFGRAAEFIGPRATVELDRFYPEWRKIMTYENYVVSDEFIDLYGVRQIVATELESEGVRLENVPGSTHMAELT